MACEVSPAPATSQQPVFSPLTLFECTVTNAQMLVESMADRELLRALRIANTLHMHIMGVMEPRYDRVCQRSAEHDECSSRRHSSGHRRSQRHQAVFNNGAAKAEPLPSDSFLDDADALDLEVSDAAAVACSKEDDAADFYDDDDCHVIEEEEEDGVVGAEPLAEADFAEVAASASILTGGCSARKRRRRGHAAKLVGGAGAPTSSMIMRMASSSSPTPSPSSSSAAQQVAAKAAIRQAYKEIKGSGPHLFDFNLPFQDPANCHTAELVISRAMQLQPQLNVPDKFWWSQLCPLELNRQARSEKLWRQRVLMRRLRSKDSKLVRRQRSFEFVASSLTTEEFDKFRLILSRDYTSSDEEVGGGPIAEEDGGGGGGGGALRVRELAWESDEVRAMKRRLDEAYLGGCANARQVEQLRRIERSSGCLSGRPPPADCPSWAMKIE